MPVPVGDVVDLFETQIRSRDSIVVYGGTVGREWVSPFESPEYALMNNHVLPAYAHIPADSRGRDVESVIRNHATLVGGTISNPATRFVFHDVNLENFDTITLQEMFSKSKLPISFRPEGPEDIVVQALRMRPDDIRNMQKRPNWVMRTESGDRIPELKDRVWTKDYGVLVKVPYVNSEGERFDDVLLVTGCHYNTSVGMSAIVSGETMLERDRTIVRGVDDSLEFLARSLDHHTDAFMAMFVGKTKVLDTGAKEIKMEPLEFVDLSRYAKPVD